MVQRVYTVAAKDHSTLLPVTDGCWSLIICWFAVCADNSIQSNRRSPTLSKALRCDYR